MISERTKLWFLTVGFATLINGWLAFCITFFFCATNPEGICTISINDYGEGLIEKIIMIITLPFTILFIAKATIAIKRGFS